jgi:signal transduction histidine kinase
VTDLLAEVIGYIQLDDRDQTLLRALHPRLAPHFPAIAEEVIASLARHGRTPLSPGPVILEWMARGLLGPHDEAFYEHRSRRGREYIQSGLPQHSMFATMNALRMAYATRILELYAMPEAAAVLNAVNKLIDIELAVLLRCYQIDAEEKVVQRERRIQVDKIAAMQTLSNGLAHEVRNPLNAAALQLELLERRLRRSVLDDTKLVEPIQVANHELARLTAMLNEFLQFARPPELQTQDQDVIDIVKHVVEVERPLARRRRVELRFPYHAPVIANVDSGKLHQIVQNLVRNGVEATPPGGHVELAVKNGDDKAVHICVRDDGPGIPAEVLPRIYEPFFSTKESGTGMGMAIVHSLVAMHRGKIDIATSPNGTQFDVELPRS